MTKVVNLKVLDGVAEKQQRLILSSKEFVAGFHPPEYLVDGILQRRFIYSLTAPTGAGKTAIALLLSYLVGEGGNLGEHEVSRGRVLYLAGENPDDVLMRWLAMSEKLSFDVETVEVYFHPGRFSISKLFERVRAEIEDLGEMDLIVVDTSAAYFDGDDENNNVQMGDHARMLRHLTTLPGRPCVVVACHPTKGATNDRLVPRGGGAFVAEMDGNLVCLKKDSAVDLHWHEKLRGPDFAPMSFQLLTVTSEKLKDRKGRPIPTVMCQPLTERVRADLESAQRKEEDELLTEMLLTPRGSLASRAQALGWLMQSGEPAKYRVQRVMKRLEGFKYVRHDRDGWALTDLGKEAARKAS